MISSKLYTLGIAAFLSLATPALSDVKGAPDDVTPSGYLIERLLSGETLGITPGDGARPVSSLGLSLIKHFEGWFASPYNDPVGYCTIGYGHLLGLKRCSAIDVNSYMSSRGYSIPLDGEDGERLLNSDTAGARRAVERLVTVPLSRDQFSALASFVFNLGEGNFRKSTLLRLLNGGRYDAASNEFPRWVRAGGRVLNGLVIRRACERTLFLGRLRPGADGEFSRDACETLGIAPSGTELLDIDVITGEIPAPEDRTIDIDDNQ